jgi:FixJ family two-component response regulator
MRSTGTASGASVDKQRLQPFRDQDLLDAIDIGLVRDRERRESDRELRTLLERFETLMSREREVMSHER